jgi:hypothetical protein
MRNKEFANIDPDDIPVFLKLGVPAVLGHQLAGAYWGAACSDFNTKDKAFLLQCGAQPDHMQRNIAEAKTCEVIEAVQDVTNGTEQVGNARQVLQILKNPAQQPHVALPIKCDELAPRNINVYSDGSWVHIMLDYTGLGGSGVIWPKRELNDMPLSDAEKDMSYQQVVPEGLRCFAPIGGLSGSSTRTELAAAIIALLANTAVHIGTDSAAFKARAERIIQQMREGRPIRTHWKTLPDGDLWEYFTKAVEAKGPFSIKISKVKGHATQPAVDSGEVQAVDKEGNDAADIAADCGTRMHGSVLNMYAALIARRHKEYKQFVCRIHHHILEAYDIHRKLSEQEDAKIAAARERAYVVVSNSVNLTTRAEGARHLRFVALVRQFPKVTRIYPRAPDVQRFLQAAKFQTIGDGQRGTTWLELYLVYRLSGCRAPLPWATCRAAARPSAAQQLNAFKTIVRRVARATVVDAISIGLFALDTGSGENLLCYGISGRHAAINARLDLAGAARTVLTRAVLHLTRSFAQPRIDKIVDKQEPVTAIKLNLRGKTAADHQVTKRSALFLKAAYDAGAGHGGGRCI